MLGGLPIPAPRTLAYVAALAVAALLGVGIEHWRSTRSTDDAAAEVKAPEPAPRAKKARKARARPPAEKACLPPPTDAGPEDMVASAGLDPDAVRVGMRTASRATLPCFADSPSVTLTLSINVACTGRVARVEVEDDGGASPEVQACVREALGAAEFPAHALPDGDTFRYPLTYTAPG